MSAIAEIIIIIIIS